MQETSYNTDYSSLLEESPTAYQRIIKQVKTKINTKIAQKFAPYKVENFNTKPRNHKLQNEVRLLASNKAESRRI